MCQFLFFLRHGEVAERERLLGQSVDTGLSEEGWVQAKAWAERLREIPFQAIVTSPALRARQTAEPFQRAGVPCLQLPHFHEVRWGHWEGLPYQTAESYLHAQQEAWAQGNLSYAAPGGESWTDLLQRAQEGLRLITTLYPTGNLLIITHGQLLRTLFCALFGYPSAESRRFHHKRGQLSWLVRLPVGAFYLRVLAADVHTPF